MNRRIAAAAITALILGLTACNGSDEVTTKPNDTTPAAAPSKADKPSPKPKAKKAAGIGDSITVTGSEDGEKLDVTVKKVVDPARSSEDVFGPEDGKRWVAVQFELTNTGTAVYSDSPSNGTQVADSDGQRFGPTFADVTAGPSMTSDAQVPPGEKALGYIVFEVPKASKIVTVQFTMNSGYADQTAQWKIS